jgi:hypothetical protein
MNKPLPLLAIVCALAAPIGAIAPAVQPAPAPAPVPAFNPANLLIVSWNAGDPAAAAAKAACKDGTLVAYKDVVEEVSNSLATRGGKNESIPLYCARVNADKNGSVTALTAADALDLSVYYPHIFHVADPWSNGADYKLNRSLRSLPIDLRQPGPNDFQPQKPVTPPAPVPPVPQPAPNPRPTPNHAGAVPLTAHEKNWLALDEFIDYRAKIAAAKTPADKKKLYAQFRQNIQNNLPPASVGAYTAELAKTPAATAAARKAYETELDGIVAGFNYAPNDIALTPDETTKLKTLPSASGAPKTQVDDYQAELAADKQKVDDGEKADAANPNHDAANVVPYRDNILYFRTTTAYRKKIGGGPANPGGGADPSLGLPDALKPWAQDKWPAYQTQRDADLKVIGDPSASAADKAKAQSDLSAANESILQVVRGQQAALKPADVQGIQAALSGAYSKYWGQLCLPYNNSAGGAAMTAAPSCLTPDQVQAQVSAQCKVATTPGSQKAAVTTGAADTTTGGMNQQCVLNIKKQMCGAAAAPTPAANPAGPWKPDPSSGLGLACLNNPSNPGTNPAPPPDVGPSGAPPSPAGVAVANTSDATPAKPDPNIMTHVRTGITGALAGMILGMLGGPIGMLIGAGIGFGLGYVGDMTLGSGTS